MQIFSANWFPIQFYDQANTGLVIAGNWNSLLIFLSVLIAIYSSVIALQVAGQARKLSRKSHSEIMIIAGSVALGGGVWAMHFLGMLAFNLSTAVEYSAALTLFSMTPSVAASWVALKLSNRSHITPLQLVAGGVLMGSGIGLMHYTGMAAMQMQPMLLYDPVMFVVSILVAVSLAMLSLWIRFGITRFARFDLSEMQLNLVSGTVMGVAISGMHYTGMGAARFLMLPDMLSTAPVNATSLGLALGVAVMTITISSLVLSINLLYKHKEVSRQAIKSEQRLRETMATAIDAVLTLDGTGTIIEANSAAHKLFAAHPGTLPGNSIKTYLPGLFLGNGKAMLTPEDGADPVDLVDKDFESEARDTRGVNIPVRVAIGYSALDDEGMYVIFITDISQRIAMENDLRRAKEIAEESANAREVFLANMSHEIRTPMNAVIGYSNLLLNGPRLDQTQLNQVRTISNSATSLLHLLNDILDIAKLEKGKMELHCVDFCLTAEAEKVISTFTLQAQEKGLLLESDFNANLLPYYHGAPDKIRQILTNLVSNAIKFTDEGKVRIDVYAAVDNGDVLMSITDTGIGIAENKIKAIFDPFQQADASVSSHFGGTGLGTAITKELVELMGGSITVSSKPGVGSCFTVRLPLPAGEEPQVTSDAEINLPALSILIADDLRLNIELLQIMLADSGHRIVTAHNGSAALYQAMHDEFDVILMDMRMPEMNGVEATRAIRRHEIDTQREPVPIIALTASVFDQDRKNALEAGMNGFISKPVELSELISGIAQVLNTAQDDVIEQPGPQPEADSLNCPA